MSNEKLEVGDVVQILSTSGQRVLDSVLAGESIRPRAYVPGAGKGDHGQRGRGFADDGSGIAFRDRRREGGSVKKATVDQVMALNPCERYDRKAVKKLFGRRRALSAADICRLPIPIRDRIWALVMLEMFPWEARMAFAVDCALRAEEYAAKAPHAAAAAAYAAAYADAAAAFNSAAAYAAYAYAYAAADAAYAAYAAAYAAAADADAGEKERKIQDESLLAYCWEGE